jgi:predicted Fe-Mo cluster-binding NifX family protein
MIPMKQGKNEIAVCTFLNRVCPRFDLSHEILIYDTETFEKGPLEKIDVSSLLPEAIFNQLARREIQVVIVGGMQERYQAMFLNDHIEVIWGVIGEVSDVIRAYRSGVLYPGVGGVAGPVMPKGK